MAIQILGTEKKSSGGGGLGKLLGFLGGAAATALTGGAALPAMMAAGGVGSTLGGIAGEGINPAQNKQMGIGVKDARQTIIGAPEKGPSAIDRMNQVLGIGSTLTGAIDGIGGKLTAMNAAKANQLGAMNRLQNSWSKGWDR